MGQMMDPRSTVTFHTGNSMPLFGLGTWQLTRHTAATIATALKLGYRLIDTSGDYKTQPSIAEGIRRSKLTRDNFFLVTKVEETDDAYEASQQNLRELQLDYVDLMLIHRPPPKGIGEALWRGLMRARDDGLTRDIGVSNYSTELINALIEATGEVPVLNQIEWSPFGYSKKMLEYASRRNMVIQAYSPLTRTQKLGERTLTEIAAKYRKSPAQILIRWNLQHGVACIPKANRETHLAENIDVFDFQLSDQDIATLDKLNERYSSLGELPYE